MRSQESLREARDHSGSNLDKLLLCTQTAVEDPRSLTKEDPFFSLSINPYRDHPRGAVLDVSPPSKSQQPLGLLPKWTYVRVLFPTGNGLLARLLGAADSGNTKSPLRVYHRVARSVKDFLTARDGFFSRGILGK
jgi:hypothetical protein